MACLVTTGYDQNNILLYKLFLSDVRFESCKMTTKTKLLFIGYIDGRKIKQTTDVLTEKEIIILMHVSQIGVLL